MPTWQNILQAKGFFIKKVEKLRQDNLIKFQEVASKIVNNKKNGDKIWFDSECIQAWLKSFDGVQIKQTRICIKLFQIQFQRLSKTFVFQISERK